VSGGKLEGSAGAIFWRAVSNGNLIALRYLDRYIAEAAPSLEDVDGIASLLAERNPR
jgi:hypothetical protein